jgi:hypothetical protein
VLNCNFEVSVLCYALIFFPFRELAIIIDFV